MGKNELILLQIVLESVKLLIERQQADTTVTDEELDEVTRRRKEAVERLEQA